MSTSLPDELWDVDRLAGFLGSSRWLVYRLTREHRIGYVKVGKELRFRPEDVAAYLEAEATPAGGVRRRRRAS